MNVRVGFCIFLHCDMKFYIKMVGILGVFMERNFIILIVFSSFFLYSSENHVAQCVAHSQYLKKNAHIAEDKGQITDAARLYQRAGDFYYINIDDLDRLDKAANAWNKALSLYFRLKPFNKKDLALVNDFTVLCKKISAIETGVKILDIKSYATETEE